MLVSKRMLAMSVMTIVLMLSTTNFAMAVTQSPNPDGQPFQALWNAINAINAKIATLQTQIDNIHLTPGPQGPPGTPGHQGPPGVSGYEMIVNTNNVTIDPGNEAAITAKCSPGKSVLGGGASAEAGGIIVRFSAPDDYQTWDAGFRNVAPVQITTTIRAIAICGIVQ
jgi:hypothetical protein